ncbi:MAG: TonB-dependent receptor, partial [Bacteroidia bacterium]|nr:TonB-dependent receptor [Bacteroidia bacterium]
AGGGYVTRSSMNLHSWQGLVSNLEKTLSENLTLNVGFDLRTYYGKHFRIVENFHGLSSWKENIRLRDQNDNHQTYGSFGTYKFVETTRDMSANPWAALFADFDEDEKIAYSNDERISYGGIFAQLEYEKDNITAFFQGALSNQWHQRFDYYQYADQDLIDGTSSQSNGNPLPAGIEDGVDSEKVSNIGFNLKAGGSYAIDDSHKVYANAGYYSRQPFHDNIFPQFTNQIFPLTENETIIGLEAGYSFRSKDFRANLNLYRTEWKDRVTGSSSVVDDVVQLETNFGVSQVHTGVEIDFIASPFSYIDFKGFLSVGDWQYKGDAKTQTRDEEQNIIPDPETGELLSSVDVDGVEVGGAAQFTAGLGVNINFTERLKFDSDMRYYDRLYADVGARSESLELPSYHLVDMGLSYRLPLGKDKDKSLTIRGNINNVFDYVYISNLRSNIQAGDGTGELYKGIDTANQGYFGFGRTWNLQLRYRF